MIIKNRMKVLFLPRFKHSDRFLKRFTVVCQPFKKLNVGLRRLYPITIRTDFQLAYIISYTIAIVKLFLVISVCVFLPSQMYQWYTNEWIPELLVRSGAWSSGILSQYFIFAGRAPDWAIWQYPVSLMHEYPEVRCLSLAFQQRNFPSEMELLWLCYQSNLRWRTKMLRTF